jgi:hypothetical protein
MALSKYLTVSCRILALLLLPLNAALANNACLAIGFKPGAATVAPKPALIESKTGALLHAQLDAIVKQDQNILEPLLKSKDSKVTLPSVLNAVFADRRRITGQLEALSADFKPDSAYAIMLNKVIELTNRNIDNPAGVEDLTRPMYDIMPRNMTPTDDPLEVDDHHLAEARNGILRRYLNREWVQNRTSTIELMTALETKGLIGFHEKIGEIVPSKSATLLRQKLSQANLTSVLNVEIDIVARDPVHDGYMWIDVRTPLRQITAENSMTDNCVKTKKQIDNFMDVLDSDDRLKSINSNISLQFLFRGGGISTNLAATLSRQYKLNTQSGSVEAINLQMTGAPR